MGNVKQKQPNADPTIIAAFILQLFFYLGVGQQENLAC